MLHCRNPDVTFNQRSRESSVADIFCPCLNLNHWIKVDTTKYDATVDRRRLQGQVHFLPGMQTNTSGAYFVAQSSLLYHGRCNPARCRVYMPAKGHHYQTISVSHVNQKATALLGSSAL
jgi:hypothetical protein